MSKSMPGHLIAVLVVLGLNAFALPSLLFFPLLMLAALLAAPTLIGLLPVAVVALFGWFTCLLVGLVMRQGWAPRWTRITAAVMCGLGGVSVAGAFVSDVWAVMGLGDGVLRLGFGWYLLWAVGRADVRAWLAGADGPIDQA
jgi:hypothetical protein